jgi:hypothetical protein
MPPDDNSTSVADEFERLLCVYGAEAVDCLKTLETLLTQRIATVRAELVNVEKEQKEKERDLDVVIKAGATKTDNGENDAIEEEESTAFGSQHQDDGDQVVKTTAMTTTTGNVENIVLQTLQMEQQRHDNNDEDVSSSSSAEEMEALVQAGFNVLCDWSCLQEIEQKQLQQQLQQVSSKNHNHTPGQNEEEDEDPSIMLHLVETLCELMTKYPHNEPIQQAACVRLSRQPNLFLAAAATSTNSSTRTRTLQRILFPTLQAMNWHKNNPIVWNSGMTILTRLLVKEHHHTNTVQDDLTERQSHAMTLIDFTGGLGIFFEALLLKQPTFNSSSNASTSNNSNKSKMMIHHQSQLKSNVCHALAALALNHPPNQALIAQHPSGLSTLLDTMKLFAFYVPLQESLLQLLASLAYGQDSKSILLAKGGLDGILTCMKDHPMQATIQATGLRAIANVFAGTAHEIRTKKGSLCIKPTLRAMRTHPPQHVETSRTGTTAARITATADEQKDDDDNDTDKVQDENLSSVQIHFYGCAALRNLSKGVHARTVVEAGGIATILVTLTEYPKRPAIQEQAWGALLGILRNTTTSGNTANHHHEVCLSVCTEGGLETLLQMLQQYSGHRRIQTAALGCLACLSSGRHLGTLERIVSQKGLDLVLAALHRFHKSPPPPPHQKQKNQQQPPRPGPGPASELLQNGCAVLANLVSQQANPDFQLAIIVKNGINILLMVLQQTKEDDQVQLAACRTLCHLCRNPDNLPQIVVGSSNNNKSSKKTNTTTNGAILPILLGILEAHPNHTELNACVMEILSLLATMPEFQNELVARNGIEVVVGIMKRCDPKSLSTSLSASRSMTAAPSTLATVSMDSTGGSTPNHPTTTATATSQTALILQFGCACLSNASLASHDATLWMKNHGLIPYLQTLEKQLQRRSPTRLTIRELIQHLQTTRVFLAKFGSLAGRHRKR